MIETSFDPSKCPRTGMSCAILERELTEFKSLEPQEIRVQNIGERCRLGFSEAKTNSVLERPACGLEYLREFYTTQDKAGK